MNWFNGLEAICQADVPLRNHTWYQLGGPARWLLTPRDEPELAAALARCRRAGVPWRVLGRGANLLVRDEGFDGAVIKLGGSFFEKIDFGADGLIRAGAGVDFTKLVKTSTERGLAGLEALAGIPGTLGGIVRMNAGGKYGSISQFTRDARLLDPDGQIVTRPAAALGFAYRHTNLDGCIVLAASLTLKTGDRDALLREYRRIWNEKAASQPAVAQRSAGCIFKNPPGPLSAGALIDRAGLKGQRRGYAEISPRHANFIVAHEGATANDVLDLIALAKDQVWNATGIRLETEVEIW